ncbi:hypothetical protein QMA09_16550 [Planococcus sp. APC 3906]|uniref:hypothetical protein n=1 Tax=Planococcus sp. APC 3906 TaxID=3035194 RepID=UPI0025B50E51|nr:hypothetical protein [Planococcus sp. APC 3906]MDN3451801.1 hypothetical protein [Planococcus sp. APC 3906]
MGKKIFVLVMSFVLILGFVIDLKVDAAGTGEAKKHSLNQSSESDIYKEELANLTQEEISSNFKRIDTQYKIGEAFSLKDQTFVELYAKKATPEGITLFASKTISGSRTSNGITVTVNGTIKDDIQNIINHSFGASNLKTSTTAGSSKVTSVKTVVYHNAYGLVGSGGVGKVYSGSISTSGKNTILTATKNYTAVVAYASTWCTVTVNHTGGTFTVNPQ